MIAAIRSDRVPNLFVMQYSVDWWVYNLLLIPFFFFIESAIQKRKPLGLSARRAGWVGCNILLRAIAPEGKLRIVSEGIPIEPDAVREQFQAMRPLSEINPEIRGWTLNVLRFIRKLGRAEFSLSDLYALEPEFSEIYPDNRNIKAKIRQQLQVLRDLRLIEFLGKGSYAVVK